MQSYSPFLPGKKVPTDFPGLVFKARSWEWGSWARPWSTEKRRIWIFIVSKGGPWIKVWSNYQVQGNGQRSNVNSELSNFLQENRQKRGRAFRKQRPERWRARDILLILWLEVIFFDDSTCLSWRTFPHISFQVLQNTDSKMELEVQVIYWEQCLYMLKVEKSMGNAAMQTCERRRGDRASDCGSAPRKPPLRQWELHCNHGEFLGWAEMASSFIHDLSL